MYNSKGESITQLVQDGDTSNDTVDKATGKSTEAIKDIAVCLKDSTAVVVTADRVERRRDVDNLRYVELALQWAGEKKADIERVSTGQDAVPKDVVPADGFPGTEYAVIIQGIDHIMQFYSTVLGESAANDMLKSLASEGDITLTFHVSVDTHYLGVAAVITVAGEDKLLWYIDNYTEVYDWSLGSYDWYKYNYKDADKNEKMIQEAVYNATSMLNKFGPDTGLAYNKPSSSKTTNTQSTSGTTQSTSGTTQSTSGTTQSTN